MNPLSPLAQQSKGKSNVRLAVISIIALHAVFFGGLLLQGCKPKTGDSGLAGGGTSPTTLTNDLPPLNPTNLPFAQDPTQPLGGQQGFGQVGQPLTPSAPTNTWPISTIPPAEPPPVQPAATTTEYVVKAGDIPARIAKDHGVSVNALMAANPGVDARRLKVGQKLQVPAAPPSETGAPGAEPAAEKTLTHVVKTGETLTKIAKTYGLTVKELRTANNLKTDRINVGQKLKVPGGKPAAAEPAPAPTGAGTTTAGLPATGLGTTPR